MINSTIDNHIYTLVNHVVIYVKDSHKKQHYEKGGTYSLRVPLIKPKYLKAFMEEIMDSDVFFNSFKTNLQVSG